MDKIYFLILNFRTRKETQNCINSIEKLEKAGYESRIVVIDNASGDGSYEYLKNVYKENSCIEFYKMDDNVGFSKANNYGYSLIRNKKDVAFIIVCNSDIEFCQKDILVRISKEYKRSRFYILGPCIFCESELKKYYHGYQSPAFPYECKKWYVCLHRLLLDIRQKEIENISLTIREKLYGGVELFDFCIRTATRILYARYRKIRHENTSVHGSCIILSPLFIEKEKKLFYPETQFYGEERLLYLRAKHNSYKTIYEPGIKVNHLQGRATKQLGQNTETELFKIVNLKYAANVYLEELEKYK